MYLSSVVQSNQTIENICNSLWKPITSTYVHPTIVTCPLRPSTLCMLHQHYHHHDYHRGDRQGVDQSADGSGGTRGQRSHHGQDGGLELSGRTGQSLREHKELGRYPFYALYSYTHIHIFAHIHIYTHTHIFNSLYFPKKFTCNSKYIEIHFF